VSARALPGDDRHEPIVVAVDCNGADLGAAEVAAGARLAVANGARVILFGPGAELGSESEGLQIVDAPLSIAKSPDPVGATRSTPEASIVQCAKAVAEGRAQALVCAGATGAALAAGIFNIKRAPGIYRPALALVLPIPGNPVTLLDVGANTEARREHLVQFAFMGGALAETLLGVANARVGLLSNGQEPSRGSKLILETHSELSERAAGSERFQFVGNLEGGDLLEGRADVVVTDGLTGNIALKLLEGVSQTMLNGIRSAAASSPRAKLGGALLRPSLRSHFGGIDPEAHGGAYLLGLRRLGVVPHGRFHRRGFAEAILRARQAVADDLTDSTHAALRAAGALRPTPASAQSASLPPSQ
jgi:phosphate acyltransferase